MSYDRLKKFIYKVFSKKPGRRFLYASSKINHYICHNLILKIVITILGVIFLGLGFLMLFLPGPGLLFILLGVISVAVSSRKVAYAIDKLEQKINFYQ